MVLEHTKTFFVTLLPVAVATTFGKIWFSPRVVGCLFPLNVCFCADQTVGVSQRSLFTTALLAEWNEIPLQRLTKTLKDRSVFILGGNPNQPDGRYSDVYDGIANAQFGWGLN